MLVGREARSAGGILSMGGRPGRSGVEQIGGEVAAFRQSGRGPPRGLNQARQRRWSPATSSQVSGVATQGRSRPRSEYGAMVFLAARFWL